MRMKTLHTLGAAMLSGAVGLGVGGSAHAAITINGQAAGITYAKETIDSRYTQTNKSDTSDTTKYYTVISASDGTPFEHSIAGPAEITANSGHTYIVKYTLSGMVFTETPTIAGGGASFGSAIGGAAGYTSVTFLASSAVAADNVITLTAKIAVSENGGTITREVTNKTLADLDVAPSTKTYSNNIMVKPAIKETVVPADAPVAKAEGGFMRFGGTERHPVLHAELGSIRVGVNTGYWNARANNQTALTAVTDITQGFDASAPHDNTVTVSGDTSFLKKSGIGFVAASAGCTAATALTDIRKVGTDGNPTAEILPQNLQPFTAEHDLCIMADGETAIPAGSYAVSTKYKGLANAAFPTMGATHVIGSIKRDGTTYDIPFLTVNSRFKQRLTIINRGSSMTTYTLGSLAAPKAGSSVTALAAASGNAMPGHTTLLVTDMIEVSGATRASGQLTLPAPSSTITASLDIINPENGTIDTTILTAE